jgi:hypothetical protein
MRDGTVGRLSWVGNGAAQLVTVVSYGRHYRVPASEVLLLDFAGDERDERDRLMLCGPCGAIYGDHLPDCPRAGRPQMRAAF